MKSIRANYIDILGKKIIPAEIKFDKTITCIEPIDEEVSNYIIPGFVDAHVHIESSMLVPSAFAPMAVVHGTVATVSDPHEIANVLGVEGVDFMIENGDQVNFKFNFGAPSCVPATKFETAGAEITSSDIDKLLQRKEIKYLAEMMNWPGVLFKDEEVLKKIAIAKKHGKPVDGHAPGLLGQEAIDYISAGIYTDHECFTYEEALHKVAHGMNILIREGSAAKNFDALIDLLETYPDKIMFCSDDKHPDDLLQHHIDELVRRSLTKGLDLFDVLRVACINPVLYYGLDVGLLRVKDPADFIIIDSVGNDFKVLETYIDGELVAKDGVSSLPKIEVSPLNTFRCFEKQASDFNVHLAGTEARVIEVEDGQLITKSSFISSDLIANENQTNVSSDILKLSVVNRYEDAQPAVAMVKNFGLKKGAIASTVAHDSHNIIAVGTNNADIVEAVNLLIESKGGVAIADGGFKDVLPLEVAGLMSIADGRTVAKKYTEMTAYVKNDLGSKLQSPFMTLSFLALLVIPQLKLSDKGLFDGKAFEFVSVFK